MRLPFLTGEGGMIGRVRAVDWAATPLGDAARWCPELVTAVSFVLESKFPAALVWGAGMTTIYNDAFRPILGDKEEGLGRSFRDIWAEAWGEIGPIVARAYAGEATFIEDFPLTVARFGYPEKAYFTFCYSPVRLADGTVAGMIDTVVETSSAVRARDRARLLNTELGHRLKNAMAMVQAIAQQSLKGVVEREAVDAFKDRIQALGEANDVLLATSWTGAPIGDVVRKMLALHGGGERFVVDGEGTDLGPRTALSLSLLLHELATNAAKHGSLAAGGTVLLDWRTEGGELVVSWRERGGPPARDSGRKGFGSRIIDMGLDGTGDVTKRYGQSGFEAEFRAPLARSRQ